jgi:hypothetical protein
MMSEQFLLNGHDFGDPNHSTVPRSGLDLRHRLQVISLCKSYHPPQHIPEGDLQLSMSINAEFDDATKLHLRR